jgi:hypothetical protein
MNSIFVQMASYRDPQLIPTLQNLISQAEHPKNLRIVVCWQHGDDESTEDFLGADFDIQGYRTSEGNDPRDIIEAIHKGAIVELIDVPHFDSQGACWARNKIQQCYNGEKYTLQLDSHHRFVKHWDTKVIEMLESVRYKSKKPVLTAYIPSFDPENDPQGRVTVPWKMDFDRFIPEGAVFFMPASIDDWKERKEPMRARFYSGHFAFADGSFAVEVQHDPDYFFHGEEISIGVRAFTHGYDLYHPIGLIAWHEYTRKGRTKVWDDHTTPEKKNGKIKLDWVERNNLCHRRNRILFGMDGEDPRQIEFGKYGFGTERTLQEFERFAGMSFKYRAVQQYTIDKKEPVYPVENVYDTEQAWRDSMTTSNDVRICFHTNHLKHPKLDKIPSDFDFWYVAAHDADGEIFRKDPVETEIKNMMQHDWIDYRLIFLSNRRPTKFVVWPHSKTVDWGERFEIPIKD